MLEPLEERFVVDFLSQLSLGASAGAQPIGSQERTGCLDQDKARSADAARASGLTRTESFEIALYTLASQIFGC